MPKSLIKLQSHKQNCPKQKKGYKNMPKIFDKIAKNTNKIAKNKKKVIKLCQYL
jgi:hypothetical protein